MKYLRMVFCIAVLSIIIRTESIKADTDLNSSIDANFIEELRGTAIKEEKDKALMNALTNNKLSDISLNRNFLIEHRNSLYLFDKEVETSKATDQERSGRCWLFAGLNLVRQKIIDKYELKDFALSQNYLFFWDKMEKSNYFLETIINSADVELTDRWLSEILDRPIGDGGLWSYVVNLIEKYGVMPVECMPESYNSRESWHMNRMISRRLRRNAIKLREMATGGADISELRKQKKEMLRDIYRMLVMNLGEPPAEFRWIYENSDGKIVKRREMTPHEFYKNVVDIDLKKYRAIMNYPGQPFDTLLEFENSGNMYEKKDPEYANMRKEELEKFTLKSILNDEPVWFACDIIKDKEYDRGVLSTEIIDYNSLYGLNLGLSKKERIRYRDSHANHAMVILGVDTTGEEPEKWLVEDSHGESRGHNGRWSMYNDWFHEYAYIVIINEKYLPEDARKIFEMKPKVLPPWDPMVMILKNNK